MGKIFIGLFNCQKITETLDENKFQVKVYLEETPNGREYIAISEDNKEHILEPVSNNGFYLAIGEDTYILSPEDGDIIDV